MQRLLECGFLKKSFIINDFMGNPNCSGLKTWKLLVKRLINHTGRFMSEAPFFASTDPQYDNRFFIELPVQYNIFFLTFRTIYLHNMFWECSELAIFMYWTSMNNLLPYFGLINSWIRASEKDLSVHIADIYKKCKRLWSSQNIYEWNS